MSALSSSGSEACSAKGEMDGDEDVDEEALDELDELDVYGTYRLVRLLRFLRCTEGVAALERVGTRVGVGGVDGELSVSVRSEPLDKAGLLVRKDGLE